MRVDLGEAVQFKSIPKEKLSEHLKAIGNGTCICGNVCSDPVFGKTLFPHSVVGRYFKQNVQILYGRLQNNVSRCEVRKFEMVQEVLKHGDPEPNAQEKIEIVGAISDPKQFDEWMSVCARNLREKEIRALDDLQGVNAAIKRKFDELQQIQEQLMMLSKSQADLAAARNLFV